MTTSTYPLGTLDSEAFQLENVIHQNNMTTIKFPDSVYQQEYRVHLNCSLGVVSHSILDGNYAHWLRHYCECDMWNNITYLFLLFNLSLCVMLDSLSCPLWSISLLIPIVFYYWFIQHCKLAYTSNDQNACIHGNRYKTKSLNTPNRMSVAENRRTDNTIKQTVVNKSLCFKLKIQQHEPH